MDKQSYADDLKSIRDIMNRSSRFISLSGLSGVSAGIIALGGVWVTYKLVYAENIFQGYRYVSVSSENIMLLLLIAALTLILALGSGILFTNRKAKKNRQKLWDFQTKRLLINLAIPLFAGGVLCLILLSKGFVGLLAPLTLIFYGLSLVNASKYTLNEIRSLGVMEVILGLLAANFIGYGLLFWAMGFGVLHIIYGIIMHVKHGS